DTRSAPPYTAVLIGYRTPGYDSPDYAASEILKSVLNSQRADLFALQAAGKAYQAGYFGQTYRKIGMGVVFAAVPITTKPGDVAAMLRSIIDGYRKNGVPAALVEAAKRRAIADMEYKGDSISGLAFEWSQALAVQHTSSPDAMLSAYQRVTVADVDRVLRASFDNATAVTAYAVPKLGGALTAGGPMKQEDVSVPPTTHQELPVWARSILAHLSVPEQTLAPVDMTLPNGIRLIVQPEHVTHVVEVSGSIRNDPQVQEPAGKDGVADITTGLLSYGTTTYSRLAYAAQLDKIAATTSTGTSFSLSVLANHFERGVQLLADEELHPALDPKDFAVVQHQELQSVTDEAKSPDHLAEVALANALYPVGDPMRRFATPATVGSVSLNDVNAWYKDAYRPDLTTIVVVGDITPAHARTVFEKYFGGWTASGPTPNVLPGPVALNGPGSVHVPATGRVQSSVRLVESIGLLRKDPDWANLEVANTALTGGFYSSLLYHDLREVHGYAYAIGSTIAAGRVRSTYEVSYGSNPENVVPAEQQVIAILDGLQRKPLEPARLLRAKAMLMGDVPIREASYGGVMNLLLDNALRGLPLDENLVDARRELSATQQSVQASVAKWIRPQDFVRVIVGPGPK
ncbi:MAG: insulinase family protein, partial [Vulcanimicrobiaceae bacterium]